MGITGMGKGRIQMQSSRWVSHVSEDGRVEDVVTHLEEVSALAEDFAMPFGGQEHARIAGIMHDVGKYSQGFQKRILENGPRVDHSTAGAYEIVAHANGKSASKSIIAHCIAGHHGGLPDGGSIVDTSDEATLCARVKRASEGRIGDYSVYENVIKCPDVPMPHFENEVALDGFALSFYTRMIFSCLVDADYLCTEAFMRGKRRAPLSNDSFDALAGRLESKLDTFFPPKGKVNELRCELLNICKAAASGNPGVYSLTVPTGGGKTYASLRFALQHIIQHKQKLRRVIYALPYTSIIEQNAQVFRSVLGARCVLEHHSNFDFDDVADADGPASPDNFGSKLRLATENWDVPVVVTTNVQLFESLYSNKSSRCRRLHNIAGSVLILDEAQMIPTAHAKPCVRALAELVHRYNCTIVLCTATQPALNSLFNEFGCNVTEINPNPPMFIEQLRRVTYIQEGKMGEGDLVTRLQQHDQALCVVNNRKQARSLYRMLCEAAKSDEARKGIFHLSTSMRPIDRRASIAAIRSALDTGEEETCVVISTSLIEAGVDFDFPVVYRQIAGLDSIVQCAGRCNREGRRDPNASFVHVFDSDGDYSIPPDVKQRASITQGVIGFEPGSLEELSSLDLIDKYSSELFNLRNANLDKFGVVKELGDYSQVKGSKNKAVNGLLGIPYRTVADKFRFIDNDQYTLIIPDDSIQHEIENLKSGNCWQTNMRKLAQYSVNIYPHEFSELRSKHALVQVFDRVCVLEDQSIYNAATGLDCGDASGKGVFY